MADTVRRRRREPIYIDWGWREFKLARAKARLTQQQVADRLGGEPSKRSIASWEKPGTVPTGKVVRLVEFYEGLGITPETLRSTPSDAVRAAIEQDPVMSKERKRRTLGELDMTEE